MSLFVTPTEDSRGSSISSSSQIFPFPTVSTLWLLSFSKVCLVTNIYLRILKPPTVIVAMIRSASLLGEQKGTFDGVQ